MRKSWVSYLLTMVMGISIVLSYVLIFDANILLDWWGKTEEAPVETQVNEDQTVNYFTPAGDEIQEVFAPDALYIHQKDQTYRWLNNDQIQEIEDLLEQSPLVVDQSSLGRDSELIKELLTQDHVQLTYAAPMPLTFAAEWLEVDDEELADFQFDRLLLMSNDHQNELVMAYLVDAATDSYLELPLEASQGLNQWYTNIGSLSVQEDAHIVDRYYLDTGFVYLPDHPLSLDEHLFTLDRVSETQIVKQVFPDPDYIMTPATSNNVRSYQNIDATLTIYTIGQTMSLITNRQGDFDDGTFDGRLRESFSLIQDYDYWQEGLRYVGQSNGIYTYRRYFNQLPIYTLEGNSDYSTSRIQMRERDISDVIRTQMPLMILQVEIPDDYQSVTLPSGPELAQKLHDLDYALTELEDIALGYEWVAQDDDLKLITLRPGWFVRYDDHYYSVDQLEDESIDSEDSLTHLLEGGRIAYGF